MTGSSCVLPPAHFRKGRGFVRAAVIDAMIAADSFDKSRWHHKRVIVNGFNGE